MLLKQLPLSKRLTPRKSLTKTRRTRSRMCLARLPLQNWSRPQPSRTVLLIRQFLRVIYQQGLRFRQFLPHLEGHHTSNSTASKSCCLHLSQLRRMPCVLWVSESVSMTSGLLLWVDQLPSLESAVNRISPFQQLHLSRNQSQIHRYLVYLLCPRSSAIRRSHNMEHACFQCFTKRDESSRLVVSAFRRKCHRYHS